jgi:glycerate-2-kinase
MKLFRTAISAVDPYVCVKDRLVAPSSDELHQIHVGEATITLRRNLYVAAFGKAALGSGTHCAPVDPCYFHFDKACAGR